MSESNPQSDPGEGGPFGTSPPIVGPIPPPFTPPPVAGGLADFNAARNLAWTHCSAAVELLVAFMGNEDFDMGERATAAAELLQFAAKGLSI